MYHNILTEVDAAIGIVTLNRAEQANAFDGATVLELLHALAAMESNPDVRVLVVSSTGRTFCAGADLAWMQRVAASEEDNLRDARNLAQLLRRLADMPKPTLVRVQGAAYGGGVGLIAACDIAVATADARFSLSEVKLGLIPAAISPHVIAAIGERYARRYMLTAEPFSAAEAHRIGLVHEVAADVAALDETVGHLAEALLENAPAAMAECKALIRAVSHRPLSGELVEDTAQRIARVRAGDEAREGLAAFLQKRKPDWRA